MMPIGQFGVDGCHLDGGRAQYMLLEHWEVTAVIEMVVGKWDDREVHKAGKVVTREWRKA